MKAEDTKAAFIGRKPDWILRVKHKRKDQSNKVGAGWNNEAGGISIQLDVCVVLHSEQDVMITLFPNDYPST